MNIKKVLVTGGAGFVGSHLVERLVDIGCDVRCFIRYNSRNDYGLLNEISSDKLKEIDIISGDLRDYNAILKAMSNIDTVFHLGALIAIPYSYKHPKDVIETNIMGTFNALSAARDCNITKFVHTSTSEVYGTAQYVPIDEAHPLQGQSPYSASKIGADKIAESFYNSYNLPVATIRPFNIYGPRQSLRAVIPTIITQALTQDEICLGSLKPTRDYTIVFDSVEAFIKVAKNETSIGKAFNIGSNFEISIGHLANEICSILNKDCKIIQRNERMRPEKSEVERLWADSSLASKVLGWHPQINLKDGLRQTINWIKENLDKYQIEKYVT